MFSTVIDTGETGTYFNAKPTSDGGIIAVWENDSSGKIVLQKFDDFDCYVPEYYANLPDTFSQFTNYKKC